jgi:hypothetical protein
MAWALAPSSLAKPKPEPTAFALVNFPVEPSAAGYQQRFVQVRDEFCNSGWWPHWIGQQGWLYGNSTKPVKVEADKRLYLQAVSSSSAYPRTFGCINVASFVPELNHSYSVVHEVGSSRGCRVVVKDLATGEAPATQINFPVAGLCTIH